MDDHIPGGTDQLGGMLLLRMLLFSVVHEKEKEKGKEGRISSEVSRVLACQGTLRGSANLGGALEAVADLEVRRTRGLPERKERSVLDYGIVAASFLLKGALEPVLPFR